MEWLKVLFVGYLLGSIPFGYLAGKLYKLDIRNYGSGNIGFTNVMRVIGFGPAAFVLFFDALKGYISTWYGFNIGSESLAVLGALAAMVGHNWPFTLKFKGGRGVATGFGIILFMTFKITFLAVLIWFIVVILTRYVSLGSITAAFFVPIAMYLFDKPQPYIIFAFTGASIVIIRHWANIKRLMQGNENKIGNKINLQREEEDERNRDFRCR
ncbi:MAG: acyl phosphate:glycerol-3-phosphate acyltransferase [Clostridia bacterium]|nr:acyl phosphate:glycerol-3-phosphate acyltransferase [Clostridia bacterium]MDN5322877.1 acyl phosphate:glycerol-3-phosphate acyltransferase [Clostridia bacterium]